MDLQKEIRMPMKILQLLFSQGPNIKLAIHDKTMTKINRIRLKILLPFSIASFCFFLNGNAQNKSDASHIAHGKPALTSNIKALINLTLKQPYDKLNTDWFGTIRAEAILRWAKKKGILKELSMLKNGLAIT